MLHTSTKEPEIHIFLTVFITNDHDSTRGVKNDRIVSCGQVKGQLLFKLIHFIIHDSDIPTKGSSNVLIKRQIKRLLNIVLTSYRKMEFKVCKFLGSENNSVNSGY